MAKSRIIKELANGSVDTMTALKRAKVLLTELESTEIKNWVDFEMAGYPQDAILPDYRKTRGNLIGSYFKGSMISHMTWTNVSLPLGKMPEELKDSLLNVEFRESVEALKELATRSSNSENHLAKLVPADVYPGIANYNDDPFMMITSAKVIVAEQFVTNILASVESRLLDILILLEKEFGNLDELDIDVTSKKDEDVHEIAKKILVMVYNDHSITIGDNNRIKDADIASTID